MSGTQLEHTLDLIDANLLRNREQVLRYIEENPSKVREALERTGILQVPTSAGIVDIDLRQLTAA